MSDPIRLIYSSFVELSIASGMISRGKHNTRDLQMLTFLAWCKNASVPVHCPPYLVGRAVPVSNNKCFVGPLAGEFPRARRIVSTAFMMHAKLHAGINGRLATESIHKVTLLR